MQDSGEKPIIQIRFIPLDPSTGGEVKIRVHDEGDEKTRVDREIAGAIAHGGVWDSDGEVFYPWHSISRVEWQRSPMYSEEVEAALEFEQSQQGIAEFRAKHGHNVE